MNYNQALKSITKDQKIMLINIFDEVKKTRNFISFDGGHLSSEGHQKIFEIVIKNLSKNKLV